MREPYNSTRLKHLQMQIQKAEELLDDYQEKVDKQECFLKGLQSAEAILLASSDEDLVNS